MPCLVCHTDKTIKAHLIPKAFVNEIKANKSENHLIMRGEAKPKRNRNGRFDDSILCKVCDQILGNFENNVFQMLKKVRGVIFKSDFSNATLPAITYKKISGNEVIRFAAGLIWKFEASKTSGNGITIGPYYPILERIAFRNAEIPSRIDLLCFILDSNSPDSYFYREPLLDRLEGINVVRFSVGRCVFFLKTDRRAPLPSPFNRFWLRNQNSVNLIISPGSNFEETEIAKKLTLSSGFQNYFESGNFK